VLLDDVGYLPDVDESVEGSIQLVVYRDGRVQFAMTGCFKHSPQVLADLLESLSKDSK
jgi:hypothetical protein